MVIALLKIYYYALSRQMEDIYFDITLCLFKAMASALKPLHPVIV